MILILFFLENFNLKQFPLYQNQDLKNLISIQTGKAIKKAKRLLSATTRFLLPKKEKMSSAKQYKLSKEEKLRMANRINYFRTMPAQVLKSAGNLNGMRTSLDDFSNHEIKSTLVNGRVMILNVS